MYLYILRELFLLYSIRTAFLRVLVDYLSGDQKFAVYSSGKEAYTEEKLAVYGLPDQYSMEAVVGNDVYLSIDKDLQQAVYQILEQTIAGIRCIKYKEWLKMNTEKKSWKIFRWPVLCALLIFMNGCSAADPEDKTVPQETIAEDAPETLEKAQPPEKPETAKPLQEEQPAAAEEQQTIVMEKDWSGYFDGLNGTSVFYYPSENQYKIYNTELSDERRSPCSTFKIISGLIGIEEGVIPADDSTRSWSGEIFWNENWNQNMDFENAFRTSCIWYFREVINELGSDVIQKRLEELQYGNCDISDWEGRLNTSNNNRSLTGFWVESSLKISPREQVEVLKRIFNDTGIVRQDVAERMKSAMKLVDEEELTIYGKTEGADPSTDKAKQIAFRILEE